jgi:hypothetical protein
MFEEVLIANRGDQPPHGGAATQPNRPVTAGHKGDFAPEFIHV